MRNAAPKKRGRPRKNPELATEPPVRKRKRHSLNGAGPTVGIKLSGDMAEWLDAMAVEEHRSRANMVEVLLLKMMREAHQ